jgi:hypothetical protein
MQESQQWTAEQVWDECNKAGEEAIRSQLIRNQLEGDYRTHAMTWLANVDRGHTAAFQAEQLALVLSTRDGAEAAARMARLAARDTKRAVVIAILAIVVATIAVTVSVIQLVVDRDELAVASR